MICLTVTLAVFVAALAGLALWAGHRLAEHMRREPEAVKAVTQHVLLPLLTRRRDDNEPPPDEPEPGPSAE
jgi:hypothetical protein